MSDRDLAGAFWRRAKTALEVARQSLAISPEESASRAYYAAFYAVSALLALEGRTFKRHSALEAAVHRDLVKPGLWPEAMGECYSDLLRLRNVGDYLVLEPLSVDDARDALASAAKVLRAVAKMNPQEFGGLDE